MIIVLLEKKSTAICLGSGGIFTMKKSMSVLTGSPWKNSNSFAMLQSFIQKAQRLDRTVTRFDVF